MMSHHLIVFTMLLFVDLLRGFPLKVRDKEQVAKDENWENKSSFKVKDGAKSYIMPSTLFYATTTFHISNCRGPLEDPGTIILQ